MSLDPTRAAITTQRLRSGMALATPPEIASGSRSRLEEPFDWDAPTGDLIAAYKASYEKWVADAHKIMLEAPSTWQEDRFDAVSKRTS